MRRVLALGFATAVITAVPGCPDYFHFCRETRAGPFTFGTEDGPTFAFRVTPPYLGDASFRLTGTAESEDQGEDCIVALYRFAEEPDPEALPEVRAGEEPPATLPGGGTLAQVRNLPAGEYVVPLEVEYEDEPRAEWLVGMTCLEAQVQLDLSFVIEACDGTASGRGATLAERVW